MPPGVRHPVFLTHCAVLGNAEIEEEIQRDRLAGKKEVKILLLGPGKFHTDSIKTLKGPNSASLDPFPGSQAKVAR